MTRAVRKQSPVNQTASSSIRKVQHTPKKVLNGQRVTKLRVTNVNTLLRNLNLDEPKDKKEEEFLDNPDMASTESEEQKVLTEAIETLKIEGKDDEAKPAEEITEVKKEVPAEESWNDVELVGISPKSKQTKENSAAPVEEATETEEEEEEVEKDRRRKVSEEFLDNPGMASTESEEQKVLTEAIETLKIKGKDDEAKPAEEISEVKKEVPAEESWNDVEPVGISPKSKQTKENSAAPVEEATETEEEEEVEKDRRRKVSESSEGSEVEVKDNESEDAISISASESDIHSASQWRENASECTEQIEDEQNIEENQERASFVPRRTGFWDHDDRFADITVQESRDRDREGGRGGGGGKLWSKAEDVDRWQHDKYVELEQCPKEQWEIDQNLEDIERRNNERNRRGGGNRGDRRLGDFMSDKPRNDNQRRNPPQDNERRGEYDNKDNGPRNRNREDAPRNNNNNRNNDLPNNRDEQRNDNGGNNRNDNGGNNRNDNRGNNNKDDRGNYSRRNNNRDDRRNDSRGNNNRDDRRNDSSGNNNRDEQRRQKNARDYEDNRDNRDWMGSRQTGQPTQINQRMRGRRKEEEESVRSVDTRASDETTATPDRDNLFKASPKRKGKGRGKGVTNENFKDTNRSTIVEKQGAERDKRIEQLPPRLRDKAREKVQQEKNRKQKDQEEEEEEEDEQFENESANPDTRSPESDAPRDKPKRYSSQRQKTGASMVDLTEGADPSNNYQQLAYMQQAMYNAQLTAMQQQSHNKEMAQNVNIRMLEQQIMQMQAQLQQSGHTLPPNPTLPPNTALPPNMMAMPDQVYAPSAQYQLNQVLLNQALPPAAPGGEEMNPMGVGAGDLNPALLNQIMQQQMYLPQQQQADMRTHRPAAIPIRPPPGL